MTDTFTGSTIAGRYRIEAPLGAGAMGRVYRATDILEARPVAVKILHADAERDAATRARFLREAQVHAHVQSPFVAQIYDYGETEGGDLFLAMELVLGESLRQRLDRLGRLPVKLALGIVADVLQALAAAHGEGVVHRDLKPDHLIFANSPEGERLKVLDFGIAKFVGVDGEARNSFETRAGSILGTPRYMSPEQAQGLTLDGRTDLYSLGVVLYEMLTGSPPFADDKAVVVMAQHVMKAPLRPSRGCPEAGIPDDVDALVLRALSKDPSERYESATTMASDVAAIVASGVFRAPQRRASEVDLDPHLGLATTLPKARRRQGIWTFVAAIAIGGLAAGWAIRHHPGSAAAAAAAPAPEPAPPAEATAPPRTAPVGEAPTAPPSGSTKAMAIEDLPVAKPAATKVPHTSRSATSRTKPGPHGDYGYLE